MNDLELINLAKQVREHAYAPYSGFKVGAALLTDDDHVYCGVNMENSSYGLTICAERNALAQAVSNGHRQFKAIAVIGSQEQITLPCGACLQVLNEFSPVLKVICAGDEEWQVFSLRDLLPKGFRLE